MWMSCLVDLRKQVLRFQKYSSPFELVDLLVNFIFILALSYFSLTTAGTQYSMLPYGIIAVLTAILRTLIRGTLAESISHEV
jgi:hypothetical protein